MKYNYLRMMLLGMLVMLCGTSFAEDKTETIDLVGNAWDNITVTAGGTSSTGGNMNISQGDIVVTSGLGYAKKGEMSIYKNGSLTIALSENVTGYITKVVLTLTNSYNFDEPGGDWTSDYSTPGTSAKVAKGETETFTTTATDKTSLTLNNNAGGKTGISKIYVEYVSASTSTLLTPKSEIKHSPERSDDHFPLDLKRAGHHFRRKLHLPGHGLRCLDQFFSFFYALIKGLKQVFLGKIRALDGSAECHGRGVKEFLPGQLVFVRQINGISGG